MKKALYALLAIVLIGGVTFGLSQSDFLKGDVKMEFEVQDVEDADGGGGSSDDDDGLGLGLEQDGTGWTPGGWEPGDWTPTGGDDEPDCDPEYYIDLWVEAEDGTGLSTITEAKFELETTSGSNVDSQFSYENKGDGQYRFHYYGSSPNNDYVVNVDPRGFQAGSVTTGVNNTCSDVRTGSYLELEYNHKVTVKDHDGKYLSGATVNTGTDYDTVCDYWSEGNTYVCETPDDDDNIYRVQATGYVAKEGSFGSTTSSLWPDFSKLGQASLIAAIETSGMASGYDVSDAVEAATGAVSWSYENFSGNSGDRKTVTMNEFAWTITVTDGSTAITNADVEITTYMSTAKDCTHQGSGEYWCSDTSYFSTMGTQNPNYEVSASGYETVTGKFDSTRTSQTDDGVNQDVVLTLTDTTDPASYCESFSFSSSDVPLAYDVTDAGDIDLDVTLSASDAAFADTLYVGIAVGGGTLYSDTDSGMMISTEASGSSTNFSVTYSGAEVGDELYAFTSLCVSDNFEITQDAPPSEDDEYELACTEADITPDSYEIHLSASSSTLHEFELEWTIVEQLIAVQTAPEWIKRSFAFKHQNNPLLQLAEEGTYDPLTLTVGTTGNGDLFYADDLNTAKTELTYDFTAADTDTVTFYYSSADGGDSLYVTSSDSGCSDSLSLTEEAEEEEEIEIDYNYSHDEEDIDFEEIEDVDECDEYPFTDVDDDDEMAPYINCLAQTGAIQGYGDGSFGPYNYITYAEVIKIVVAMTGEPLANSSDPTEFVDIDGHWAERYIKTAEALDIARPRETIYFNPDAPASRGGLLVFLARGANETIWGWDRYDIPVSDADVSDWYTYALILAFEAEAEIPGVGTEYITEGYSDGTFKGDNPIRRDEAAAMLIRAFYAWYL